MEIQFYGANCISLSAKHTRIVIDDNLKELGLNPVSKPTDIALSTVIGKSKEGSRISIDCPGEYEVGDASIYGIEAKSHMGNDEDICTLYKIIMADLTVVVLGHINGELSDAQLESIGMVDVLFVPVGGHGYTLDPTNAIKVVREIAPKLVIPTHYADKAIKYPVPQESLEEAIKVFAMEPKETVPKLKLKASELTDTMQLIVLERA